MNEGLEPLHILPPLTLMILAAAFLFMLAVIALWMLLYYLRNRRQTSPAVVASPQDVRERLREIDADASLSKDYRLSMHRLSEVMRRHLTRTTSFPFISSVSVEIRKVIPREEPATQFFEQVDGVRFDRRIPTEKDYRQSAEKATRLIGREGNLRRLLRNVTGRHV